MLAIKSVDDFNKLPESLAGWLRHENAYMEDPYWKTDSGYLIVLDVNDKPDNLDTGIEAISNLTVIDYWEWIVFNKPLHYFCCCVIIGDGFGLVFAIPEAIVNDNKRLHENIHSMLS